MKIDLVKLVEEVYKLEGEPKNVNKVFALICLQAFKEQLILSGVSQQREPLLAYHKHLDSFNDPTIYNASESMIDDYLANNCG